MDIVPKIGCSYILVSKNDPYFTVRLRVISFFGERVNISINGSKPEQIDWGYSLKGYHIKIPRWI